MNTYICKCGRRVKKSINADNTGNRLEGYGPGHECYGCPYVLSWGNYEWNEEAKSLEQKAKGYECRMSKTLAYDSRFIGSTKDKCTCSVVSLDFDFLEQISAWVKETFTSGELTGRFSRDKVRATEYCHNGRYQYALYCAQNKKGVAAKAALFEHFFNSDGSRKDMTPQQEMEKVLTDIRKAKEATTCETVPNADAAATTAESAAPNAAAATLTTSESAAGASASGHGLFQSYNASAPTGPADSTSAIQSAPPIPTNTAGAIQEALPTAPTFDYSCLPNNLCTVIRANTTEFSRHMNRSVQEYGEACINVMNVNAALAERYTGRWAQWCASVGLSVRSATRMVEVGKSILGSAKLAELVQDGQIGKSLLQAICSPSADTTAVEQVLSGNITTHKEYQDLLKENQQLRTDRVNAMNQAEREKARAEKAENERDKARADQISTAKDCNRLGLKASQEKDRADKAEARAKTAEDALKKQPIVGVTDPEEVDRLAHQQAYGIAADMTDEIKKEKDALQKQLKDKDRQLNVMRRQVNDLAQTDFEIANNFQVQIWSAWNSCKSSYSRLVGEDLESTFLAICQAMDGVKEEAARLCRQPVGYDGGADDEPDV